MFITDRGKPAHVLLSIEDDRRMTGGHRRIGEALHMQGVAEIAFDPPRAEIGIRVVGRGVSRQSPVAG